MNLSEKEIIEYLEIVFKDITDFELVSINNPITKVLKHGTKEERVKFFSVVDNVKLFAKNNDLIQKNGTGDFFKLTENGKSLKKLGSYTEYLKYIEKKELGFERLLINNGNIIQGNNYGNQSSNFSNNPQTHNIIANNKPTKKKNLIIKFWELISENKLISGILLFVILYVLKVYFNIDLKNP